MIEVYGVYGVHSSNWESACRLAALGVNFFPPKFEMDYRLNQLSAFGDAFHAHLEECAQCERHPFNLCRIGHVLLNAAGGNKAFKAEAERLMKETKNNKLP